MSPASSISARLRKMGTFRKSHEEKEPSFSGGAKDWEEFRTDVNNYLEDKDIQWIICGAQGIAKYFQGTVAERTADKSKQGKPMETDLAALSREKIKPVIAAIDKMGAKVALDLALVKNKKDVIGSSWAEHEKLKITEDQLATWHESIDQSYIVKAKMTNTKRQRESGSPNGAVDCTTCGGRHHAASQACNRTRCGGVTKRSSRYGGVHQRSSRYGGVNKRSSRYGGVTTHPRYGGGTKSLLQVSTAKFSD